MKIEDNKVYAIVCVKDGIIYNWHKNKVYHGKEVLKEFEKIENENCKIVQVLYEEVEECEK